MKHRVFIAINLPQDIKKRIFGYQEKWPELPARWTKEHNLHITLLFLGDISDEDLGEVCKITEKVALKHKPFSINLKNISYGPPKKMPPRMVWVKGEMSKDSSSLKDDLEDSLIGGGVRFSSENRGFSPHITLGRIRTWELRNMELEEIPEISEEINLNFEVNSIEVMGSQLKKGGPEYIVLESGPLG